jgi:hypothetical protein
MRVVYRFDSVRLKSTKEYIFGGLINRVHGTASGILALVAYDVMGHLSSQFWLTSDQFRSALIRFGSTKGTKEYIFGRLIKVCSWNSEWISMTVNYDNC